MHGEKGKEHDKACSSKHWNKRKTDKGCSCLGTNWRWLGQNWWSSQGGDITGIGASCDNERINTWKDIGKISFIVKNTRNNQNNSKKNRRRTNRENKAKTVSITTIININNALKFKDITKSFRVPYNTDVGAHIDIKLHWIYIITDTHICSTQLAEKCCTINSIMPWFYVYIVDDDGCI